MVVSGLDEHQVGAEADRGLRRHGAVHAELTRGITGGRDDAAFVRVAADNHRTAGEFRSVTDFHRGVERVHVDVDNGSMFQCLDRQKMGSDPISSVPDVRSVQANIGEK